MGKSVSKNMNSFHNIIILVLFVLGLFILYRYIKNLENETKILHNHIIELTNKLHTITEESSKNQHHIMEYDEKQEVDVGETIMTTNDDVESVGSEDITNMLKKVMDINNDTQGVEEDQEVDEIVDSIAYEEESINDVNIDTTRTEENDDIIEINIADHSREYYMKKTNEELRTILRNKSLTTKGSKSELVNKILQNI